MKNVLFVYLLFFTSLILDAQDVTVLHYEKCKKENVEVVTGSSIPDDYVVAGHWNIVRTNELKDLADIPLKELKHIKKYAVKNESCKVFVDFSSDIISFYDKDLQNTKDRLINVYVLVKALPVITMD